jgi:DNA-binding NtrC family response regulator
MAAAGGRTGRCLGAIVSEAPADHARVVVVDDDPGILRMLERILVRGGYHVTAVPDAAGALQTLEAAAGQIDLLMSDLHMPEMDGLQLITRVRERWPDVPIVVLSGDASARSAVSTMRMGAYDYVTKPPASSEELLMTVGRAVEWRGLTRRARRLERQVDIAQRFEGIVGTTPGMNAVFRLVESVASTDATVLLLGESGTGKELLARALHARSARAGRPFLPINCAALTETLLDSELFGHVRGAFSGASSNRAGVFEEATRGTLFLDEIGDIPPATQVRLLRVLQEGEIRPVGASEIRRVDVRIVAATHRDLRAAVRAGTFREDLFYRLAVVEIEIPPLRSRPGDIPLLAQHFVAKHAARFVRRPPRLDPLALSALQHHRWPGNVRELENAIERAVALASGDTIALDDLPPGLRARPCPKEDDGHLDLPFGAAKQAAMDAFERRYVTDALMRSAGNLAETARRCGLDKTNLRRILRRQEIDVAIFRASGDPSSD